MANVQKYFEQFDDSIRLKRFEENQTLRARRDAVLNKLRARFAAWREEGQAIPTFASFNQGSYQMGTGIEPAAGDYDIDVGLRFNCAQADYPNPVDLKILVDDALADHTVRGSEVRRSCVTVYYQENGEQAYHVDLAVYVCDNPEYSSPSLFLAKGKRGSDENNRWWESSDPQGLMKWVEQRFSDKDEEAQFLRVIRALKRWKSERFKDSGTNAPHGIGLTLAAGNWFSPVLERDWLAATATSNDLAAMRALVDRMIGQFVYAGTNGAGVYLYRLQVFAPAAPFDDVFQRMTDGQMTTFRDRLIQLRDGLDAAVAEPDPVEACRILRRHFGDAFPVPTRSGTSLWGDERESRIVSAKAQPFHPLAELRGGPLAGSRRVPLDDGLPEPWASEWGEDEFGRFAGFAVGEVVQRMRWVPPGRFLMGSPESEAGRIAGEMQHPVELTRGYWLADTPVTQALWSAVTGENPSYFVSPDRPVEQVSWKDCQQFVARLEEVVPGLSPRLPTEAEWEYACRAGTMTATWVGDLDIRGENDAPILDAIAWYGGNSGHEFDLDNGLPSTGWPKKQYPHSKAGTRPVGGKKSNPLGLYDMLGNVWEWCADWFGRHEVGGAVTTDPHGPPTGSLRVFRGGSWNDNARLVRAACRLVSPPGNRFRYLGFRLSRGQAPAPVQSLGAEPRTVGERSHRR